MVNRSSPMRRTRFSDPRRELGPPAQSSSSSPSSTETYREVAEPVLDGVDHLGGGARDAFPGERVLAAGRHEGMCRDVDGDQHVPSRLEPGGLERLDHDLECLPPGPATRRETTLVGEKRRQAAPRQNAGRRRTDPAAGTRDHGRVVRDRRARAGTGRADRHRRRGTFLRDARRPVHARPGRRHALHRRDDRRHRGMGRQLPDRLDRGRPGRG